MSELSFHDLRKANVHRNNEVFSACNNWTPMEWACSVAGEAGEICNAVKKLRRMDEGTNTAKDPQTKEQAVHAVAMEMADTIIYIDLLAARLGINLDEAVTQKFNIVTDRMGAMVRL